MDCGCKAVNLNNINNPVVTFCPMHQAAPALLDALKGCHDAIGELASNQTFDTSPANIDEWLTTETGNPEWRTLFTEVVEVIDKASTKCPACLQPETWNGCINPECPTNLVDAATVEARGDICEEK